MEKHRYGQVFVSWSGNQSRGIASALSSFLRKFNIPTFFSERDIRYGQKWYDALSKEMQAASICIICITENSIESPWVMFEAGSISNSIIGLRVIPYITGEKMIKHIGSLPVGVFQAAESTKSGTRRLLFELCSEYLESNSDENENLLHQMFESRWPKLRNMINAVRQDIEEEKMKWYCFGNACEELFAGDKVKEFNPHLVLGVNHGGAVVGGMLFTRRIDLICFDILTIHPKWQTESDEDQIQRISQLILRMPIRPKDELRILLVDDSFKTGRSMQEAKRLSVLAAEAAKVSSYIIKTAVITYSPPSPQLESPTLQKPDIYMLQNFKELPYGWV